MKRDDLRVPETFTAEDGCLSGRFRPVSDADLASLGYVKLIGDDGLFSKPVCDALERFLRVRGVYPTKGGRVFPGDKVVGSEDVLEVILEVAIDQEDTDGA